MNGWKNKETLEILDDTMHEITIRKKFFLSFKSLPNMNIVSITIVTAKTTMFKIWGKQMEL